MAHSAFQIILLPNQGHLPKNNMSINPAIMLNSAARLVFTTSTDYTKSSFHEILLSISTHTHYFKLPSWSRELLEKITTTQFFNKYHAICETRRFMIILKTF